MPPPGAKPILTMEQIEDFGKHHMHVAYIRNFEGLIAEFDTNLTLKELTFVKAPTARQGPDDGKPLKKTLAWER